MDNSTSIRDGCTLVRNWIFEHALKHGMKKIVTELLRQQHNALYLKCTQCADDGKSPQFPCINPHYLNTFMFSELLEKFEMLLLEPLTLERLSHINIESVMKCQENLEIIHSQEQLIPFSMFCKFQVTLKTLVLLMRVVRNHEKPVITSQVDLLYPRQTREHVMELFQVTNQQAQEYQEKERACRLFINQLLLKDHKRDNYIQTQLLEEVKELLQACKKIFPTIINQILVPAMPETYIEKIMGSDASSVHKQEDPAVQVLLDFLQSPNLDEDDLICVLKLLDPETPITATAKKEEILNLESDDNLISSTQDIEPEENKSDPSCNVDSVNVPVADGSDDVVEVPNTFTMLRASLDCQVLLDNSGTSAQSVVSSSDNTSAPKRSSPQSSTLSSAKKVKTNVRRASELPSTSSSSKRIEAVTNTPKLRRKSFPRAEKDFPISPEHQRLVRTCSVKLQFQNDTNTKDGDYAIFA